MDLIGVVIGMLCATIIALMMIPYTVEYFRDRYPWESWQVQNGWIVLAPLPILGALIGYILW